jgi:hypothetical protein
MAKNQSDRPVVVTAAEERAHPALRRLARACLALARQLREGAAPNTGPGPGSDAEAEQ